MASNDPGSTKPVIAGALTYPVKDDDSKLQPVADQPKQPKCLQGLLVFALEATKGEDAPDLTKPIPMDEERMKFITEALRAHTVQISEVLRKNMKILSTMENISCINENDELPEHILAAFDELAEYLDDIDIANDFERIGGLIVVPMCYSCKNIELHRRANMLLAQVCQNNPRCQESALRCRLMPVLLYKVREDKYEERSLRALSSMIRDYEPGMLAFISQGGCEMLIGRLLKVQHSEFVSAVFLISYLCQSSKEARDKFINNGIIQIIVEMLKTGRSDASEYLLNILVVLLETQPAVVLPIYRDPALDLRRTLENHLQIEDVKNGRFIEEKECCEKIIQLAFVACPQMNGKAEGGLAMEESADR